MPRINVGAPLRALSGKPIKLIGVDENDDGAAVRSILLYVAEAQLEGDAQASRSHTNRLVRIAMALYARSPAADGAEEGALPDEIDLSSDEVDMLLDRVRRALPSPVYAAVCQIVDPAYLTRDL